MRCAGGARSSWRRAARSGRRRGGARGPGLGGAVATADRVLIVAYPGLTWARGRGRPRPALVGAAGAERGRLGQRADGRRPHDRRPTATSRSAPATGPTSVDDGRRLASSLQPSAEGFVVPRCRVPSGPTTTTCSTAPKPGALGTALQASGHPAAVVGAGTSGAGRDGCRRRRRERAGSARRWRRATRRRLRARLRPTCGSRGRRDERARPARAGTPEASDPTLARVARPRRPRPVTHLVLVVSPSAPADRAELTVFALAGAGVRPGQARSATTRRAGYVTLPDVAPTVLARLGVEAARRHDRYGDHGGRPAPPTDPAAIAARAAATPARCSASASVVRGLGGLPGAAARRLRRWPRGGSGGGGGGRVASPPGCVAVLAFPPLTFLSGLGRLRPPRLGRLRRHARRAAVAGRRGRRGRRSRPAAHRLLAPAGRHRRHLAPDGPRRGAGWRLQFDTPFGYSPITAARFTGMGNLAFALLMVRGHRAGDRPVADVARRRRASPTPCRARAPTALLAAGRGGLRRQRRGRRPALRSAPTSAACWPCCRRSRSPGCCWPAFGSRAAKLAAVVGAAVVAVVAFAAYDLSRPAGRRTHLGRFARQLARRRRRDHHRAQAAARTSTCCANVGVIVAVVVAAVAVVARLARRSRSAGCAATRAGRTRCRSVGGDRRRRPRLRRQRLRHRGAGHDARRARAVVRAGRLRARAVEP